jgi:hypothetical protein
MNSRRVTMVILCEDSQQAAFASRFLDKIGWDGVIRIKNSPKADGSAEQWVRLKYPEELLWYRQHSSKAATALVVIIDADKKSLQERVDELNAECRSQDISVRKIDERVALAIPMRNIETWIHYLNGEAVDEVTTYSKLDRARECKNAVEKLVSFCRKANLPGTAPSSLIMACTEYHGRIKPIIP